jgi:hypothetical protein
VRPRSIPENHVKLCICGEGFDTRNFQASPFPTQHLAEEHETGPRFECQGQRFAAENSGPSEKRHQSVSQGHQCSAGKDRKETIHETLTVFPFLLFSFLL